MGYVTEMLKYSCSVSAIVLPLRPPADLPLPLTPFLFQVLIQT